MEENKENNIISQISPEDSSKGQNKSVEGISEGVEIDVKEAVKVEVKRGRGGSKSVAEGGKDRWVNGRIKRLNGTKLRQKQVIDNLIENGNKLPTAIRDSGYSDAYAANSHKILETKTFQELLTTYLPDSYLLNKHQQLIDKTDRDGDIDANATSRGLDMAYKLKGAYKDNLSSQSPQLNQFNFYNLKPEDVNRRLEAIRSREARGAGAGDGSDISEGQE